MIIIKLKLTAAAIPLALALSLSVTVRASDNTLTITHIAETPDGEEYTLGIEEIKNINDIYYYSAEQSPVASKLLAGGYTLKDEKNKIIEADIVSNGGEINLKYVPIPQKVLVTYYKKNGDEITEIGTIEDSAYVGRRYTPVLPMGENDTESILSDESHLVKFGENNFAVTYEDKDVSAADERFVPDYHHLTSGNGALLTNFDIVSDKGYIYGYGDGTFRPDRNITKEELFNMLSGVTKSNSAVTRSARTNLLGDGILTDKDLRNLSSPVTWEEFSTYAERIDEKVSRKQLTMPKSHSANSFLTRADAVAAINSLIEKTDNNLFISENKFSDVYEDHWAFFEILKATAE